MLDTNTPVYPVRIVLRRTGLTAELLRAWERRYGVVAPGRTDGGQRLYSEADVIRLSLLRRATQYGHSIGRIAELSDQELDALLVDAPAAPARPGPSADGQLGVGTRRACLEAIQWMDGAALDAALRRAAVALGPVQFAEQVVAPLVREIGELWHAGRLRIVQEHLATSTIRQVLSGILAFAPAGDDAPVFVAATTTGQRHELGAMMAAAVAAAQGWRAVYLGPDLPGEEIGIAAARLHAGAIGLSLVFPTEDAVIDRDLADLAEAIGRSIPVYVGGEGTTQRGPQLAGHGFTVIPSLTDLGQRLART